MVRDQKREQVDPVPSGAVLMHTFAEVGMARIREAEANGRLEEMMEHVAALANRRIEEACRAPLAYRLAVRVRRYCRACRRAGERVTLRAVVGDVVEPSDELDVKRWDGSPGWIPTRDGGDLLLLTREPWAEVMAEGEV